MNQIIKVNSFFLTENDPIIDVISAIEITDMPNAKGGFGLIYECLTINGKTPQKLFLIKILTGKGEVSALGYNSVLRLQKKMKSLLDNRSFPGYKNITDIPALKAFPIFSFDGVLNGEQVYGYSSIDLTKSGFVSFDDVLNETGIEHDDFKQLSFKTKFQYCFHLAKGFEILNQINYVHADINPKNIFINPKTGEAAIIDYDGGSVVNTSKDTTVTFGKPDEGEWLAPEIYEMEEANQKVNVNEYADRWSVSIAFHYLLFGYDPFFFIREQSKKCKEEYLKSNKLYPINLADENVLKNAIYYVPAHENNVRINIPKDIHNELLRNYQEGFFSPQKRTSYEDWSELFSKTQMPPVIEYFKSDKSYLIKGAQINLSWEVKDAIELSLNNQIGDVTSKKEITLTQDQHITYCLTAYGHFGITQKSIEVSVFPLPVIEYLKIPTPEFVTPITIPPFTIESASVNITTTFEKTRLTEIHDSFISLANEIKNSHPVYKHEQAFLSISHLFNKIKDAINFK